MPSPATEEEIKPKRAPRKRVSSAAEKKVAPKKPRKTAAKKVPSEKVDAQERVEPEVSQERVVRKAPTVFATQKQQKKQKHIHIFIVAAIILVGVGASAAVGFTDDGQINVNQVIDDRNERVRTNSLDDRDVASDVVNVPVQNTNNNNQVDGGLVGLGSLNIPSPATTTASTTDDTATATESVATSTDDGVEQVADLESQEPAVSQEAEETEDIEPVVDEAASDTPTQ